MSTVDGYYEQVYECYIYFDVPMYTFLFGIYVVVDMLGYKVFSMFSLKVFPNLMLSIYISSSTIVFKYSFTLLSGLCFVFYSALHICSDVSLWFWLSSPSNVEQCLDILVYRYFFFIFFKLDYLIFLTDLCEFFIYMFAIFSHSVACLSTVLMWCLWWTEVFLINKLHFTNLFFCG